MSLNIPPSGSGVQIPDRPGRMDGWVDRYKIFGRGEYKPESAPTSEPVYQGWYVGNHLHWNPRVFSSCASSDGLHREVHSLTGCICGTFLQRQQLQLLHNCAGQRIWQHPYIGTLFGALYTCTIVQLSSCTTVHGGCDYRQTSVEVLTAASPSSILLYTIVNYCILAYTRVYYCMLFYTIVYYCKLVHTIVYYCILVYTIVYTIIRRMWQLQQQPNHWKVKGCTRPILLAAPSFHLARRICSLLVENPVATQIGRQLSDCTRWAAVELYFSVGRNKR